MSAVETTVRDGLVYGMPETEYHDGPELSSTFLKAVLDSPALAEYARRNPTPPTEAMEFGTVVHARVLGTPDPSVVIEGGRGVTERKNTARAEGRIPITAEQDDAAWAMKDAVYAHDDAAMLLDSPGRPEVSGFVTLDDQRIRVRFDRLADSHRFGLDLKTSLTADPRRLPRIAEDARWHLQAALYLDALALINGIDPHDDITRFLHVVVGKTAPYPVTVIELDPAWLDGGRAEYRQALAMWRRWTERPDVTPAYGHGIHALTRPGWGATPADLTEE